MLRSTAAGVLLLLARLAPLSGLIVHLSLACRAFARLWTALRLLVLLTLLPVLVLPLLILPLLLLRTSIRLLIVITDVVVSHVICSGVVRAQKI